MKIVIQLAKFGLSALIALPLFPFMSCFAEEQLSPAAKAALDAVRNLSDNERGAVLKELGAGSEDSAVEAKPVDKAMDDKESEKSDDKKPHKSERYAFHYQGTIISMKHDRFRSPYENPTTSLHHLENDIRTSSTATLFTGFHFWDGGEFYFDPEIAGGQGFSGATGIAGFPNGDITRVGKPEPTPYVARLFLRETIGFGGETENVESGPHALAGTRDVDRLTLTLGKFAANDIFDSNSYSHDPRSQFMNWSLMDQGAWDYPADVRGYSPGFVADFNQKNWAIRAGAFLVADRANGQNHDFNVPQALSYNLEGEYRYSVCGKHGIIRPLAYLNRAHMGSYEEAVANSIANGTPPILNGTRKYRNKYGASANLEQQLLGDLGAFFRAGWNDGHTETWMFTEIDRSVSVGLSLNGTRWHRPDDTIGLAGVVNGIAGPHRDFLAAGGTGFIIGDGHLNYSTERIVEMYYRLAVQKEWSLTLDYQHVENPAYNRDRGPVNIGGVRLHFEF